MAPIRNRLAQHLTWTLDFADHGLFYIHLCAGQLAQGPRNSKDELLFVKRSPPQDSKDTPCFRSIMPHPSYHSHPWTWAVYGSSATDQLAERVQLGEHDRNAPTLTTHNAAKQLLLVCLQKLSGVKPRGSTTEVLDRMGTPRHRSSRRQVAIDH